MSLSGKLYPLFYLYGKFSKRSTDFEDDNILSSIFYFWNDCKQDYMEIVNFILGACAKFLALAGITGGFLYFISALSQTTPSDTLIYILIGSCIVETVREVYYEIVESERFYN